MLITSTPHVAAQVALQALKVPLAWTLASGYARLLRVNSLQMSTVLIVRLHM